MKKYLISGFNTVQDVKLEVGTYTLVAYVKSMHGDVYTFALWDGTDWEEFSIDVIQGQLCKVWLTFTIDKKATKFKPIANNFTEELPVYVADLQLTRGNIPVESGASPFDIDQILNDLHDEIDAIEDFTEGAFLDGLLSREEKTQLRASLDSIGSIVKSVEGSYDKLKINPFINQDRMADINRAYNNFMVAWINSNFDPKNPYDVTNKGGLKDIILWIVDGDEIVDENERVEKDRALEAFNSALYAYNLAEKEVYKDIGDEIEGVQNEIDGLEDFTNKAFEDGIIDRAEAKAIEKYINTVNESFETIEASYNELMLNVLLLTVEKNTLKGWYNALLSAKDSLMDTILIAIEDGIATPAEKEAVDDAFIVYNNAMKEYQVAFEVAREAIEKERLKDVQQEIDEAKQSVTDLGEEIDNAFSDSSITNIEANSLDLLRKNLAKEVADVVAIATSISVSVVDVNAKMSTLNTEINKYVGKDKYPITVKVANRNSINTAFANLEASLVALYDAIEDKKVQSLEDYMEGAFQDGVLDEGEKQKIRAYLQSIEETMGRAESQYAKVFGDTLLIGDARTNLFNAKVNLWGRRDSLVDAINIALDSTKLTQAQIDNVNKYLNGWQGNSSFNALMKSFQNAIEEARKSIDEQRIKNTIVKVDVEYALGDSMTEAPTTGWKTIADPWQKNKYMWSRIATYYKGNPETPVYSDETCIAGARGIGVESITERYYHSTSATELLGGAWSNDAPTPQLNMYIWARSLIKYSDASVPDKYTDPIMASGFSGKTISISASATSFRTSKEGIETPSEIIVKAFASNTTITSWLYSVNGGEFKTTNKPHNVTGSGNTRTIPKSTEFDTLSIMVTDGTLEDVITINRVSDAITITETIDYYGVSASETVEPQTWHKNTIPTKTPEQYLWNYERIEYSNGDWYETEKHVIQGKDPRSIESIKNQYIYSTSDTTPPSETAGWKDTIASLGVRPANSFLWIRDYIVYSYGDNGVTKGRIVKEGADGYSVTLSKETHSYTYDKDNNLKGLLSDGATTISVQKGDILFKCDTKSIGLAPVTNNTYRVIAIEEDGVSYSLTARAIVNDEFKIWPSAFTGETGSMTFTIRAMSDGVVSKDFKKTISFSKNKDGGDGEDGITISQNQQGYTYRADLNGDIIGSLANGMVELTITSGSTPITCSSSTSGVIPTTNGTYRVTVTHGNEITTNQSLSDGKYRITPEALTVDEASVELEIKIMMDGVVTSYPLILTYRKQFDGADGKSTEFIFKGSISDTTAPTLPSTNQQDDWYGQGTTNEWNDDLVEPTKTLPYVWASQRKKVDGVWGAFTPPKVWLRYADGIVSTTIEYAKSSNGDTPPSSESEWDTSLPSPTEGWYLWTRTTTTYKIAITTVSYSVSHWAKDGEDGYSVSLSKSEHTFNYDKNGNLKRPLSDGMVMVEVMKGSNALTCDSLEELSPTVDNTYRVTSITQSPASSFAYNVDRQNNIFRIIPTQIDAEEVMVTFTIVARTNGINATFNRKLKYQKSYDGTDGDDGLPPEIDTTITQYALGESKTEHPVEEGQVWAPLRIIEGQTFPAGYIDIWQDDRKHLVPNEATPYEWSRQRITYKNSTQVMYVGYVLMTNISPASYMFGEWACDIKYVRDEKAYPIVTYLKKAEGKPLYYYPKKEGVIEYIQFSGSVLYKKGDIVLYENTIPPYNTPLGLYRAKLDSNSSYYSPDYSSWWENVTSLYAPNGVEGQKLWEFADGVELIITEAIMANYAKLDEFVFNKGKMFSQRGTLNGVSSNAYTDDDHEPNFEVDGISGRVKMKDSEVEGVIVSRNNMGSVIASMNIEDKGEYIQYYPSGNKMMEFNGGVITYYENDVDNTVLWTLGRAGAIISGNIDRWQVITLTATTEDGSGIKQPYIDGVEWRVFVPGSPSSWGSYRGLTITNDSFNHDNPSNIPTVSYIPNGWYTNSGSSPMIFDGGYYREIVYYQSGYKTNQTKIITF